MSSRIIAAARAALVGVAAAAWMAAPGAAQETTGAPETSISHGVSAFGDLRYSADFEHFDYVYPEAPRGGSIRLLPTSASQTFNSFNPYIVDGDPAPSTGLMYDTLMVRALDEPDAVYGLVAESVEMPEDRAFAIFRLRPEARFADGSALTAEDVAWSVATLRDEGSPGVSAILSAVEEITVIDAHTIRFDFADAAGRRDMPAYVAGVPIFSKTWFDGRTFNEPSLEAPLGSGPYALGDFEAGDYVEYVRREDYWAWDLPVMRGQFNFDSITLLYYDDRNAALIAFFGGDFDFHQEFTSRTWATGYDVPAVEDGWIVRAEMPDGRPAAAQGWWFNTRLDKFSDPRVREAIAMVYNFELANRQQFYDSYQRTTSPFANSDLVAEGEPDAMEGALLAGLGDGAPEGALGPAFTPPVHGADEVELDRSTRREALRLLSDAGWTVDRADGLLKNADGEPLTIEFLDRNGADFLRIVGPFIDRLADLGIRAEYVQIDVTSYQERVRELDFDVITARFVFPPTPGPSVRVIFHSEVADAPGTSNIAGVASPQIDEMILKLEQAATREEFVAAARAFDRLFRLGHYWVPQWYGATYRIAYWDRFGRPQDFGIPNPTYDRGVIATWWVDPERDARLIEEGPR